MMSKIVRLLGGMLFTGSSLKLLGVGFLTFNGQYAEKDLRFQPTILPFPNIFHYNKGGVTSEYSEFRIIDKKVGLEDMPAALRAFIENQGFVQADGNPTDKIEIFEAYCRLMQENMNYFTHAWAMDKMIENRVVVVSSGMFDAVNLSPVNGEVGVNTVVDQVMSFHDKFYLSGNSARFKVNNFLNPAEAWFVSIYDPTKAGNVGKNAACNQIKRAVVVHWYFIPEPQWEALAKIAPYGEIINAWYSGAVREIAPLFMPQK